MFANKVAIETLVNTDTKATPDEKAAVMQAIRGELEKADASVEAKVISFADAAKYIGKPRKSIYNLLRNGTLKGFYSGKTHARATGVTRDSLEDAVKKARRRA